MLPGNWLFILSYLVGLIAWISAGHLDGSQLDEGSNLIVALELIALLDLVVFVVHVALEICDLGGAPLLRGSIFVGVGSALSSLDLANLSKLLDSSAYNTETATATLLPIARRILFFVLGRIFSNNINLNNELGRGEMLALGTSFLLNDVLPDTGFFPFDLIFHICVVWLGELFLRATLTFSQVFALATYSVYLRPICLDRDLGLCELILLAGHFYHTLRYAYATKTE